MACDTTETDEAIEAALVAAIAGPQSVTVDGQTVQSRSVKDLIELSRYLSSRSCPDRRGRLINRQLILPGNP
jgi:hypothetical protein